MKLGFYVARRLGLLIPVLLGVTFITFALTRIIPGDPIEKLAGPYVSAERKAELRQQYSLDEPFYVQYVDYVEQLSHGDLGRSLGSGLPVASDLSSRFAATFELTTTALLIALWLPATVMGFAVIAPITRLVRQGMIEALESPSTTALQALGAKPSSIVFRHSLKNALLPVTTMVAIVYGYLLGGSVLIETIFAWPGMGLYVFNAVASSDFPAVQGFILYATTMYILVFLVLDLLYLLLDPRV